MKIVKAERQEHYFDCMLIRTEVFILEQMVSPKIELDDDDRTALHYVCYDSDLPVGTCRVVLHDNYAKVGRVCVLQEYRKNGVGNALMKYIEQDIEVSKCKVLILGAQLSAQAFYRKLGYQPYGDIFLDADIEHIMMKKEL